MQTVSYNTFTGELIANPLNKRLPMNGTVELTHRCPLDCVHCYNNLSVGDSEAAARELTTEEHIRIIDEIAEAGCLLLTFTGGEILVRKDFLEIYSHAKKRGLFVTLFTNGSLLTPQIADYLASSRPHMIEISLYGHTRETHESVTRTPGSFDRCLNAIRLLCDRSLPLNLKAAVTTLNAHEIPELQRFATEEFGAGFRYDPMIMPRTDASQAPVSLRVAPEWVVERDLSDALRSTGMRKFIERTRECAEAPRSLDELYQCNAGMKGFSIDPYGGLGVCLFATRGKYDLRGGSFDAGWGDRLLKSRSEKVSRETKCTTCSLRSLCGWCPPARELEKGDAEEPVDYYCEIAHLRARAFDLPIRSHGECAYCTGASQGAPVPSTRRNEA